MYSVSVFHTNSPNPPDPKLSTLESGFNNWRFRFADSPVPSGRKADSYTCKRVCGFKSIGICVDGAFVFISRIHDNRYWYRDPIFWLVRSPTVDKWAKSAVSLSCVRKSVNLHKKPTILFVDATDAPWFSREHSETPDHLRDIRWTFHSTTGQDLPPVECGSRVCSSLDSSSSWTSS